MTINKLLDLCFIDAGIRDSKELYRGAMAEYIPLRSHGSPGRQSENEMPQIEEEQNVQEESRALDYWKGIDNIDAFLDQMYKYYIGQGIASICLGRVFNLLTMAFVVALALVLAYCVDYASLLRPTPEHRRLWASVHFGNLKHLPFMALLATIAFAAFWLFQCARLLADLKPLRDMHVFFRDVLGIRDHELETVDLEDVVGRVVALQQQHPISADKLNALDMANRIMRKENYLIALFNKDIVNVSLNVPHFGKLILLTKILEWNLQFAILNYVFSERHAIRPRFLKESQRDVLAAALHKRFKIAAAVNLLMAPFVCAFLLVYCALRYGEEIYNDPQSVGARQYTPYARWRMREFNELPHSFEQRVRNSHRKARKYVAQFQTQRFAALGRFVSFVAGSFIVLLVALSLLNEDALLKIEVSRGRSVLFYVGLFGALLVLSKALVPDDTAACEPIEAFDEMVAYTHYLPTHWRGRAHTRQVHAEVVALFPFKLSVVLQELVGVVATPFMLWFLLPSQSAAIVDFFREFTVHVEGIGYVCSFAVFDFKRHGNPKYGATEANEKHMQSRQGKMEKSFFNFRSQFPRWEPDAQGSVYLAKVQAQPQPSTQTPPPKVDWAFSSFFE